MTVIFSTFYTLLPHTHTLLPIGIFPNVSCTTLFTYAKHAVTSTLIPFPNPIYHNPLLYYSPFYMTWTIGTFNYHQTLYVQWWVKKLGFLVTRILVTANKR